LGLGGRTAAWGSPGEVARTVGEARRVAERVGYPLVVKACGPGLEHKTDRRLVRLGLRDQLELEAAVAALRGVTGSVLVERMIGGGVELILGARVTEFGPIVMVGAGGVLRELVDDVQLAMAPVDLAHATELIEATQVARLLGGWRGGEAVDGEAAARCLVQLARLICDLEDCIEEIDVNPLIVTRDGAWVADALVRRTAPRG
jgi:acetate---CoA ligase (ADP-forming)